MSEYTERLESALAKQIRIELAERETDQKNLAQSMGIGRDTLNRYLMGHRHMTVGTYLSLANALGVAPGTLLARAETRLTGDCASTRTGETS